MSKLFNVIDNKFFSVLSAPNRELYLDCIFEIYQRVDELEANQENTKEKIIEEIEYLINSRGTEVIYEDDAEVVRIFSEFLQGYSTAQIKNHLMEDKIPTPSGKGGWYPSTILSILKNEKYIGTVIQGKSFKPDVLSKKRHKNIGQRDLHTMEDCIPPIISKKMFDLVQTKLAERNQLRSSTITGQGKFSSKYPFSGIIYCGSCGGKLRRHAVYRNGETIRTWTCATHVLHGDEECAAHYVLERMTSNKPL